MSPTWKLLTGRYQQQTGRFPSSFSELEAAGLLRGTPRDRAGQTYKLMPDGRVEVREPDDFPFIEKGIRLRVTFRRRRPSFCPQTNDQPIGTDTLVRRLCRCFAVDSPFAQSVSLQVRQHRFFETSKPRSKAADRSVRPTQVLACNEPSTAIWLAGEKSCYYVPLVGPLRPGLALMPAPAANPAQLTFPRSLGLWTITTTT